eukprot:g15805.t1
MATCCGVSPRKGGKSDNLKDTPKPTPDPSPKEFPESPLGSPAAAVGTQDVKMQVGAVAKDLDVAGLLSSEKTAIIVVDFQNDFMEGGALQVPGADQEKYKSDVVAFVEKCRGKQKPLITWSQDWHPSDHLSFAANNEGAEPFTQRKLVRSKDDGTVVETDQTMWPTHCVQGSTGAAFVLAPEEGEKVQQKGTKAPWDSYSAFEDDGGHATGFADWLKSQGVEKTVCLGLALDFCVYFTATDSAKAGFETYIIPELCRGINPEFELKKFTDGGCTMLPLEKAMAAL